MSVVAYTQFRVADFAAWEAAYKGSSAVREMGHVRRSTAYRVSGDPLAVVVINEFDDRDAADAFYASRELSEARSRGGVDETTFSVTYLDEV